MAITHVKVTYSVRPHTAQRVQELSTKWGVPKSEVIRRVIDEAAKEEAISPRMTPLEALRKLMENPSPMKAAQAERWTREIRESRRASGRKRDAMMKRAWDEASAKPVRASAKRRV
jgi:predicted DNA-binding protein